MFTPRLSGLTRVLLAIGALAGVTMLTWNIVTTLRWYNALVHGNRLIEQALVRCRLRNLPALFVSLPTRQAALLRESLTLAGIEEIGAHVFGHGFPAGHDWYIHSAEI